MVVSEQIMVIKPIAVELEQLTYQNIESVQRNKPWHCMQFDFAVCKVHLCMHAHVHTCEKKRDSDYILISFYLKKIKRAKIDICRGS